MPLPHLGIAQPVRVCETCYDERNTQKIVKSPPVLSTTSSAAASQPNRLQPRSARVEDDDDKDLKLALQMSLEEARRSGIDAQRTPSRPEPPKPDTQPVPAQTDNIENTEDEDLKAAIAASLKDMESKKTMDYPSVQPVSPSPPKGSSLPKDNVKNEYQVIS